MNDATRAQPAGQRATFPDNAAPSGESAASAPQPTASPVAPPAGVAPAPAARAPSAPTDHPKPGAVAGDSAAVQPAAKRNSPAFDAAPRPKPEAPAAATQTASAAPQPAPAPPLDLTALKQRLRDTNAIGVFTKLALKNQVDDLLDKFRSFYGGQVKISLSELRQSYDLLVLKVLALLQDSDPTLAREIVASREAIWGLLADPQKFATL
jgi:hypothetical protein